MLRQECPHCGGRLAILREVGTAAVYVCKGDCKCRFHSFEERGPALAAGPKCPACKAISFQAKAAEQHGKKGILFVHVCFIEQQKEMCMQAGHFVANDNQVMVFNDYIPRKVA